MDSYTRVILTIIAFCLVIMAMSTVEFPAAHAEVKQTEIPASNSYKVVSIKFSELDNLERSNARKNINGRVVLSIPKPNGEGVYLIYETSGF